MSNLRVFISIVIGMTMERLSGLPVQFTSEKDVDIHQSSTSIMEDTRQQVNTIKEAPSTFVGFTSAMSQSVHDPAPGRKLDFGDVRYSSGSGYDSLTGIFTCPVSGIYVFQHSVSVHDNYYVDTSIMKNGRPLASIQGAGTSKHYSAGSTAAVTSLQAGDRVWIEVDGASDGATFGGSYTSFVGYILR